MFSVSNNVSSKKKVKLRKSNNKFSFLNIKTLIIIGVVLVGLYLLYLVLFTSVFQRKSIFSDIVYQNPSDSYDKEVNAIPYINLNGSNIDSLNNQILNDSLRILDGEDNSVVYSYYDNEDILSVAILYIYYREDLSYPSFQYVTYNIDKETSTVYSNEDILNKYNITLDDVSNSIESKFLSYYDGVINEEYIVEEQCDYQCFLSWREVDNYTDDIEYFIINDALYVYKSFEIYSIFGEEEYFDVGDFLFSIYKSNF